MPLVVTPDQLDHAASNLRMIAQEVHAVARGRNLGCRLDLLGTLDGAQLTLTSDFAGSMGWVEAYTRSLTQAAATYRNTEWAIVSAIPARR